MHTSLPHLCTSKASEHFDSCDGAGCFGTLTVFDGGGEVQAKRPCLKLSVTFEAIYLGFRQTQ